MLSPQDYGLIGMVTIFTVFTQAFINSGFSQALIRKKDTTEAEYSSVFYFNLAAGIFFYIVLFFSAPYISLFFDEHQLTGITRYVGLIIVFDAAALIQKTIITKEVNFKTQTKIALTSSLVSGALGIFLAFNGYGVWSLVYKLLTNHFLQSLLLWTSSRWRPQKTFSRSAIKNLFGFSSKLLASAILDKVYGAVFNLTVAKFYSAKELGLFTRARIFKDMIALNLSEVVGKVSFPVLAKTQDEPIRLKNNYKKLLVSINFIVWISLLTLAGVAEPMIVTLLGTQWVESVIYLQLLCFVGVFYPMHQLTKNILFVYGKSGLFFRLQILTKLLAVPAILTGVFVGIKHMIVVMIIVGFVEFFAKSYYSGGLLNYPILKQLKDLRATFLLAVFVGLSIYSLNLITNLTPPITLALQLILATSLVIGLSELLKLKEYAYLKEIVLQQLNRKKPLS